MSLTLIIWILILILIIIIFAVKMIKGIIKTAITVFIVLLIIIGVTGFLFFLDTKYLKDSLSEPHYVFITDEGEVIQGWSYLNINDLTPSQLDELEIEEKDKDMFKMYISTDYIQGPEYTESYNTGIQDKGINFVLNGLLDKKIKTDPSFIGFKIASNMPRFITKIYN